MTITEFGASVPYSNTKGETISMATKTTKKAGTLEQRVAQLEAEFRTGKTPDVPDFLRELIPQRITVADKLDILRQGSEAVFDRLCDPGTPLNAYEATLTCGAQLRCTAPSFEAAKKKFDALAAKQGHEGGAEYHSIVCRAAQVDIA